MQNQNDNVAKYALLTQAILGDRRLSSTDKIVLGRISGFSKFYESAAATAEFCGLSERQVQEAKRKLEKLGYIVAITNTGRGKAYRTAPDYLWMEGRPTENCRADLQKTVGQTYRKLETENKERIKREYKRGEAAGENVKEIDKKVDIDSQDVKETAEPKPPESTELEAKPERYGNEQVNDFLDRWHDATANDVSKIKRERNAAYNLIKSQSPEGLTALLEAVKDAFESMDKYAPAIRKPSDLVGQYSKLDKLRAWVARKEQAEPTAPSLPYYKDFQFDDYEPDDETREAIKAKAAEIRASGRFKWLSERSETDEQGGAE